MVSELAEADHEGHVACGGVESVYREVYALTRLEGDGVLVLTLVNPDDVLVGTAVVELCLISLKVKVPACEAVKR